MHCRGAALLPPCYKLTRPQLSIQKSIPVMKASTSKAPRDRIVKTQPKYHYSQRNLRPCGHCARLQVRCIVTPPLGSATLCHRCRKKGLTVCPPYTPRTKRLEPKIAVEEEVVLLQRPYADQDGPSNCGSPQSESSYYSQDVPETSPSPSISHNGSLPRIIPRTTDSLTVRQSPPENRGSTPDYLTVLSIRLAETTVSARDPQQTLDVRHGSPAILSESDDYYFGGDLTEPFLFDMNEWPELEQSYTYTRL